jgi:serine/threonine protein kinase/Tol biopolymer transport system component
MNQSLRAGSSVSHYRVVSAIGAGGMGEVYKAVDDSLERPVALKILPSELTKNDERVRRFIQEAKSASSLSHPHIITIYEIGQASPKHEDEQGDELHFIAMELVDGRTLKAEIHEERTDLRTIIGYLIQAADALAKAHTAGIIHRDLKPENIMVTKDGYAKILDFGLAKLTERKTTTPDVSNMPTAMQNTREGVVMGTVGYMSPEQVQGRTVDHRADIFSFGCILYEAAARERPFTADSDIEVMHKILHDQPRPVDEINPAVPAELRRVIRRCLAKDPNKRFQSMRDLAIELGEIVDEWDQLSTSNPSTSNPSISGSHSGAAIALAPPKSKALVFGAIGAAVLLAIAAAVFFMKRQSGTTPAAAQKPAVDISQMKISRLTSSGNVTGSVSISPDGKYVVHAVEEPAGFSLVVRQVATGSDIRVVPPSDKGFVGAVFSADGNYLYYVQNETLLGASLFHIPTLGGTPQKIIFDIDTAPAFSPDGKRFVFFRGYQPAETAVMMANADGSNERKLATSKGAERYQLGTGISWSPDGKSIAAVRASQQGGAHEQIVLIDPSSGNAQLVPTPRYNDVEGLAWLPDSTAIIIAAREKPGVARQLWHIALPAGTASRVTNDLSDYRSVSITGDGKTIAVTQTETLANLWILPKGSAEATQLTTGSGLQVGNVAASRDAIYFTGVDQAGRNIWISKLDGSGVRPLIRDPVSACCVDVTPDGRIVLFVSWREGNIPAVFRANGDGTGVTRLTRERIYPQRPSISPDGTWFLYRRADGETEAMKMPVAGGNATVFSEGSGGSPDISADGSQVIGGFTLTGRSGEIDREMRVYSAAGGEPLRRFTAADENANLPLFMPDGKSYAYLSHVAGVTNVWTAPLAGGDARPVTRFKSGASNQYTWTPDGALVFNRGSLTTDVVLLSGIQ